MNKFLIAGLGNIGPEYINTRHNIGFDVVDAFCYKHGGLFKTDRLATIAEVKIKGKTLTCIKPTTYMNLSGKAVKYWLDKEKIGIENLLVIVDDIALPLNKLRLRPAGGAAGHNGLKDIELTLGTQQYAKLRFGIGNEYPKGRQVDFVLGRWQENEMPMVKQKIEKSVAVIEQFVLQGIERTMNELNSFSFP